MFRKVTANKYVGENGYSLYKMRDGRFSICKDGKVTNWGTGFQTVKSAERFLSQHNSIEASADILPISSDDIMFAIEMYGFEPTSDENKWVNHEADLSLEITDDPLSVILNDGNKNKVAKTGDELFTWLDNHIGEESIFSSVILRGVSFRPIFAAKGRSSREITKNLVRVKSSNIWSYGIEIKDAKDKVGDVFIQFKGKNGGPEDLYRFYDVPVTLWRKFLGASSKGHFFWKYIRNNFLYSKLTGDKKGKLKNAVN